jgi:hypothetical protein
MYPTQELSVGAVSIRLFFLWDLSSKGILVNGWFQPADTAYWWDPSDRVVQQVYVKSPGPFAKSEAKITYKNYGVRQTSTGLMYFVINKGDIDYAIGIKSAVYKELAREAMLTYLKFIDSPTKSIMGNSRIKRILRRAQELSPKATQVEINIDSDTTGNELDGTSEKS